jgi:hypothetical protein
MTMLVVVVPNRGIPAYVTYASVYSAGYVGASPRLVTSRENEVLKRLDRVHTSTRIALMHHATNTTIPSDRIS